MIDAIGKGEIFLTCTGQIDIIRKEHFGKMRDGTILGNVGHFDREIDLNGLYGLAKKREQVRKDVERLEINSRKSLYLLCQGRVVNLVAAEGHPPEVMQLSFAIQLLSLFYLLEHAGELQGLKNKVLEFPEEIDSLVSNFALEGFNLKIDSSTRAQLDYARSYHSP